MLRPSFYLFSALAVIAAIVVLFIDLDFKSPNTNLLQDIQSLLKIVELDVFFIFVFVLGNLLLKLYNYSVNC